MDKSLDTYTRKRRFGTADGTADGTPEPSGKPTLKPAARKTSTRKQSAHRAAKQADHALQYCIQKHDASHLHYDFRLEIDGTLKSWAVPKGPSLDPKVRRLAVHVEDHPLEYGSFEGHIPEGHYGAGDVIVWDRGAWRPSDDPVAAYKKGKLTFALEGEKLTGNWHLVRTHLQGKQEQWFLIKSNDDAARSSADFDIVEAEPDSVLSDKKIASKRAKTKTAASAKKTASTRAARTTAKTAAKPVIKVPAKKARTSRVSRGASARKLEGAKAAALPRGLKPELATLVDTAPDGDWLYEIKFDGYRILARIENGTVRLFTRNGHDWTAKMPEQAKALAELDVDAAWLDGEVVVANEDGLPDFQALQNAFEAGSSQQIVFYLFDIPYLNGQDLRAVPLEQRRAALSAVLRANTSSLLRFSEDFAESGESILGSACELKLEGLIGKRAGSPYVSRRSKDWIKLKCQHRQEFVIVGYTEPKGSRKALGALLLGLHDADGGELIYAGKVGTGFDARTLASVEKRLRPLEIERPTVKHRPTGFEAKGVHWVKPVCLAEVAYAEMTRDGIIRHAVFHGLRDDKPAKGIGKETPSDMNTDARPSTRAASSPRKRVAPKKAATNVKLTHPDRIIDASSGLTKGALAQYYEQVAERMLPHLRHRPVALVRAPDGLAGALFFQKHAEKLAIPGIQTLPKAAVGQPVMMIDSVEALIGAVQMNTIEFHTWNATTRNLEKPDRFVLDLDPDPALPWKSMVEATQLALTVLDELGLKSFLKTSGGKGMHIVVPLTRKDGWDDVKAFSQAIVQHMAALLPDRFSAKSGPKNRIGKIFVDYLRNGQGATTIAPFSARAREGLPVSVPVERGEVARIKAASQWNIQTLDTRLRAQKKDPWSDYDKVKQTITVRMRKMIGIVK